MLMMYLDVYVGAAFSARYFVNSILRIRFVSFVIRSAVWCESLFLQKGLAGLCVEKD